MLEEFDDMPYETTHNLLLQSKISDFVLKDTREGSAVRSVITSLIKDKNIFSNIQVQVDSTKTAEMRHAFSKVNQLGGCNHYFDFNAIKNKGCQQVHAPTPLKVNSIEKATLRQVNQIAHFEIFTDLPAPCYNSSKETIPQTEQRMPLIVKKIAKRVKIDYLRERWHLHNSRIKLHMMLFEQVKPAIKEMKNLGNGGNVNSKQKLKRDLQSISNYDKKGKQTQAEMNESKVEYSHIFNVQSIIDMQQSFFPSRKSYPIRLYYPLKDNVCAENAILAPPPTNNVRFIRMLPKRIDTGFDRDLYLNKTYVIKLKHLMNFFQLVTLKGSDYSQLAAQMNMDYFQVKVLYDCVSKVFQLSKLHKEQRKKSLAKRDKVQQKTQEIKDHLRIIFCDIYEQRNDDLLFNPEEVFISYADLQRRVNEYFHPAETATNPIAEGSTTAIGFDEERTEEPPQIKVDTDKRRNDEYNEDDLGIRAKKRRAIKSSFIFM